MAEDIDEELSPRPICKFRSRDLRMPERILPNGLRDRICHQSKHKQMEQTLCGPFTTDPQVEISCYVISSHAWSSVQDARSVMDGTTVYIDFTFLTGCANPSDMSCLTQQPAQQSMSDT